MPITADTSAIPAVLLGEPQREKIISLTTDAEVLAPASLDWEVGNALSALVKRRKLSDAEARRFMRAYDLMRIDLVEVDLEDSLRIAIDHEMYAYDAYVIECAIETNTPLITLDKRMAQIAVRMGIPISFAG